MDNRPEYCDRWGVYDKVIVTDAYWEKENLGYSSVEIEIESVSDFSKSEFLDFERKYNYLVVKTQNASPLLWQNLQSLGYNIVECQLSISKRINKFEREKFHSFFRQYSIKRVVTHNDLQRVLKEIGKGIFTTDRVAIDPIFGIEIASRRYCNWIQSKFENPQMLLDIIIADQIEVGFAFNQVSDNGRTIIGQLGGIYQGYHNCGYGLGMLSPVFLSDSEELRYHRTSISVNNLPVMRLYQFLGYQFTDCKYVFVKHVRV